jgi:hypothetical protein
MTRLFRRIQLIFRVIAICLKSTNIMTNGVVSIPNDEERFHKDRFDEICSQSEHWFNGGWQALVITYGKTKVMLEVPHAQKE